MIHSIRNIEAFNSLLLLAKNGNSQAMYDIALLYEDGWLIDNKEIVKCDPQLAFNWTKRSYENGNLEATERYANYLSDGNYKYCEKDIELAMNLYEKAMKEGSNSATHNLGIEYRNKQKFEIAFEFYNKANSSESYSDELIIGLCFYYGIGTNINKLKAFELFKEINQVDNSPYEVDEANYLIGKIYLEGEVVEQSLELARKYLELADKDEDHRSANELLGVIGRAKMLN